MKSQVRALLLAVAWLAAGTVAAETPEPANSEYIHAVRRALLAGYTPHGVYPLSTMCLAVLTVEPDGNVLEAGLHPGCTAGEQVVRELDASIARVRQLPLPPTPRVFNARVVIALRAWDLGQVAEEVAKSRAPIDPAISPDMQALLPPVYPAQALRYGVLGTAVVVIDVDADGDAAGARIEHSSGWRVLDEAALRTARAWSFTPEFKRGRRVPSTVRTPFSFTLAGELPPLESIPASPPSAAAASYADTMRGLIDAEWRSTDSAVVTECKLQVSQRRGGKVVRAEVLEPCAMTPADRQALVDAAHAASPLPYKGFKQHFRPVVLLPFVTGLGEMPLERVRKADRE